MKNLKVLKIDAWADCCGCECEEDNPTCWSWNEWWTVDHADSVPTTVDDFVELLGGMKNPKEKATDFYDLDDDGYNVVLIEKKSFRPLYAVEYGNQV